MQFYRALAEKKLARFKQFAAIYPECCWVFLGDNGQVSLFPSVMSTFKVVKCKNFEDCVDKSSEILNGDHCMLSTCKQI